MNRIVLAAATLLALAAPAAAQYRGDPYWDRGYDRWYDDRRDGWHGRRGYDEDDDDRRRFRRSEPRYDERYEGRSGDRRGGLGQTCVTRGGTCPHPPVPVGTDCGCATSRGEFNGSVR
jgi:hypothetical protein